MSYTLEFKLEGLTKMSNQLLRGHWRVKHAHAVKWKRATARACLHLKPPQHLVHAALELTRCSAVEPDFDGLVSGFKPIIDALVECGIIITDKTACIGQPKYSWEKCAPKAGHLRIKVEQTHKEQT